MIDAANALQLARDAFSGSTTYFDANIRPDLERNLRQFQSKHPAGSKYLSESYRSRSSYFRPKTRAMVRSAEASVAEAFFSTSDIVAIDPVQETDDYQMASAEIVRALLQYRLAGNGPHAVPWFQTVIGAFQDAEVQGVVISHQEWDVNRDRPNVTLIPRENFRYDPSADWTDPVNTSPYLIWLRPMYVKDVKQRIAEQKWKPMTDAQILSAAKRYADTTKMLRDGDKTDSTDAITSITPYTVVWVHQNVLSDEAGDVMFYTLGTEYLLSDPEPLNGQYAHGRRPFVLGKTVIEAHRNDPQSEVHLVRDVQGLTNEIANQRIDNVKFAMNKRYFVRRNRQVDIRALTRNIPGGVTLLTNPDEDVKVVDTPDVTSSSYQEQDRANMDFDEVSGNMSQSSIQANRRLNETVGGMEILANDANKVRAYSIKTFIETWVEPVLRQLVLLEQYYETDTKVLAFASSKSDLFQQLGMDSVTDDLLMRELTLTVNVGMSATSPTQKINNLLTGINGVKTALADGVLTQYGVDAQEVIKEIFGALGHKDGGRFFKFDGESDPRIAQLEQQIQQLQQALEAKSPPELIAADVELKKAQTKKTLAEAVTKNVEGLFSATQAAANIAMQPGVAQAADEIARSSGFVDQNEAPLIPQIAPGTPALPPETNTNPMTPANPATGMNLGIEGGQ